MDKEEICTMLATLASVLDSLKLLRVRTSQEELESIVTRAFLEGNLDYRKGMTNYEVTTTSRLREMPTTLAHCFACWSYRA